MSDNKIENTVGKTLLIHNLLNFKNVVFDLLLTYKYYKVYTP